MTGDTEMILVLALAGAAIGAVYFGLLRIAVRALARRQSALIFLALGFARAALVITALAIAFRFNLPLIGILAALAGFMTVRLFLTRAANSCAGATPWK